MRYIDADAIKYIDLNKDMPQSDVRMWVTFLDWIKEIPTADVRPVVHGTWMEDSEGEIYCSKCGKHTYDRHDEFIEFNGTTVIALCYPRYCGNCGSLMRGDEDESL